MALAFLITAFFDINVLYVIILCAAIGLVSSLVAANRQKKGESK